MTIKRGVTVDAVFVPNATATVYQLPTGLNRAVVTGVNMFANVATTGVEMFVVPSGDSASTTTQLLKKNFAVDEAFLFPGLIGQAIEAGDVIQGNDGGNGGTDVNFKITVTEFSGDS